MKTGQRLMRAQGLQCQCSHAALTGNSNRTVTTPLVGQGCAEGTGVYPTPDTAGHVQGMSPHITGIESSSAWVCLQG